MFGYHCITDLIIEQSNPSTCALQSIYKHRNSKITLSTGGDISIVKSNKSTIVYSLKQHSHQLYTNFIHQGKASIKLNKLGITLLFSSPINTEPLYSSNNSGSNSDNEFDKSECNLIEFFKLIIQFTTNKPNISRPIANNNTINNNNPNPNKAPNNSTNNNIFNVSNNNNNKRIRSPLKQLSNNNNSNSNNSNNNNNNNNNRSSPSLKRIKSPQYTAEQLSALASVSGNQRRVLELVYSGSNLFFTGPAGCGKSYILQLLQRTLPINSTVFTSTTGITAVNINGSTIQSWSGLSQSTNNGNSNVYLSLLRNNREAIQRWLSCSILIIDEISMLTQSLFEELNSMGKLIRSNSLPFGGIQIILTGDFYQLPPVAEKGSNNNSTDSAFAFESPLWSGLISNTVILNQIYRQTDSELINLLNEMRLGEISNKSIQLLKSNQCIVANNYVNIVDPITGIKPTVLLGRRIDVEKLNDSELTNNPNSNKIYNSIDTYTNIKNLELLNKTINIKSKLILKLNLQIILLKNINQSKGLCNGLRGTIIDFTQCNNQYPIIQFENKLIQTIVPQHFPLILNGIIVAQRTQLPLDLASAISIHKSQGLTLESAIIDLNHIFEYGQAYVAMSRVKTLAGLKIKGFSTEKIKANPKVKLFYKQLAAADLEQEENEN